MPRRARIKVQEGFPMTPTGKVRKASLQEDAARRAETESEGAAP